jgi:predicted  nucleic acid-binding Zn-ribbon protein/tRNA A-37 threonylcarbamoyl transferase component Bud32
VFATSREVGVDRDEADAGTGSVTSAPALVTAAETFLRTHTGGTTVEGVVATRAFGHYRESLRQYLAIRVGVEAAVDLLATLRSTDVSSLLAAPGPRARLFHRARELAASREPAREEAAYFRPTDPSRAQHLRTLRAALDAPARELLELSHTRALAPDEIAFVLGRPPAEIVEELRAANDAATKILRAEGVARRDVDDHLLEAFALPRAPWTRASVPLDPGTIVGERYEIESHIGAGAFADVYRARDREVPDHVVALKLRRQPAAHDEAQSAARRELRLIASVFHPSVVQLKDHGWYEGRLWFVMPYYRGETLAEKLARGPITRPEARAIFEPLASALAAMHGSGVRHQDIKPENIFLAELDADDAKVLPVLLDLGVAVKDAEAVLAGTPGYFAPEVAARFAGIPDPPALSDRSDVFSLVLALRNALEPSTRDDVVGGSVDAFVARRARRSPLPPRARELAFLAPWFERWLALGPDERPTAQELARELRILTLPEEQRARRWSIVRWVAPLAVAFTALTVAAVWTSSRETRLQRLEAERAREQAFEQRMIAESAQAHAAVIREDLTKESRRRRELQGEILRLDRAYQSSRMTREDLATRLAQTEGELRLLSERHAETTRHAARDAAIAQQALAAAQLELTAARESIRDAEASLAELEQDRDRLRGQAQHSSEELEQERARVTALTEAAEAQRREAEQASQRAEEEIARLRARLESLRPGLVPPSPFGAPISR